MILLLSECDTYYDVWFLVFNEKFEKLLFGILIIALLLFIKTFT